MAAAAVRVRVDITRVFVLLCVCLFVTTRVLGETTGEETEKSCDVLYSEGVGAYLDERWQDCIDSFERAVTEYRVLKQNAVNCRIKCHGEADESPFMGPKDVEDLQFFEKMVKNTLCLLKCNKYKPKSGLNGLPEKVQKEFEQLRPYEYLQLCYFQKNLLQKAASAVFTFLVTNPDHEVMLENLKFYSNLPEVDMHQVVNFEARNFVSLYIHGSDAYQREDYKSVISYIEESLEDYLRGDEECRAYCEGQFDQGWFPDFVPSISNHFTYCLKCKLRCADKINSLNGERHDDLLASHYHFLQYAYYKVGNLEKACEAVSSYLMFYPTDETMLNNMEYYMKLPKVKKDFFMPRKEAVRYVQRQEYETKLLDFIDTEFVFQDGSDNKTSSNETEDESS